jgi:hypothetical protein
MYYKQKMIEDQNVDHLIQFAIEYFLNNQIEIGNDEDENVRFELYCSTISCLICYCNKMNSLMESFAEKWGKLILKKFKEKSFIENIVNFHAFADLLLSNTRFFHEIFFPTVNIQGIETRLGVQVLMDGKYFRLVEKKKICQDLTFHFE